MVVESKIKKLQIENEVFKLYFKLVIESIKNLIFVVVVKKIGVEDYEDKENVEVYLDGGDSYEDEEDDGEGYELESIVYGEDELQEEMKRYLQDMGNLRKLIGGDLLRFKDEESVWMLLGVRENV